MKCAIIESQWLFDFFCWFSFGWQLALEYTFWCTHLHLHLHIQYDTHHTNTPTHLLVYYAEANFRKLKFIISTFVLLWLLLLFVLYLTQFFLLLLLLEPYVVVNECNSRILSVSYSPYLFVMLFFLSLRFGSFLSLLIGKLFAITIYVWASMLVLLFGEHLFVLRFLFPIQSSLCACAGTLIILDNIFLLFNSVVVCLLLFFIVLCVSFFFCRLAHSVINRDAFVTCHVCAAGQIFSFGFFSFFSVLFKFIDGITDELQIK